MIRVRQWFPWVWAVLGVALCLALGVVYLPRILPFSGALTLWNLESYIGPQSAADKAALIQAQLQASAVLVQILGGTILIGTFSYTLRALQLTQRQLQVSQEGQITERFTRAIDQLGARDEQGRKILEVRLGGIYALERIARDSPRDHWTVMEVLTAYIRENAPAPVTTHGGLEPRSEAHRAPADIQAILTVIARRPSKLRESEPEWLDLHGVDLRGVRLSEGAHLAHANLSGTHLEGAHLEAVHLEEADLSDAHLDDADLSGAYLEEAFLCETGLNRTKLIVARLQRTYFYRANLEEAELSGARLQGTDLTEALGLTQEQINETYMDANTQLPKKPGPDGVPLRRSTRQP